MIVCGDIEIDNASLSARLPWWSELLGLGTGRRYNDIQRAPEKLSTS
jgi:hypothetical protein